MSKKQQIVALIVGGLIIIILLVLIKLDQSSNSPFDSQVIIDKETGDVLIKDENIDLDDATLEEILTNIKIPEKGDQISQSLKNVIAVPVESAPATTNDSGPSQVRYMLEASNNKFTPTFLIVQADNLVTIKISAIDKDYDFRVPEYGLSKKIKQGELGVISFAANEVGEFDYYCDSCGGDQSAPAGKLIIR